MDNQTTQALNQLAPQAVAELKNFFQSSAADDEGKRVDVALKVLGRINGNDSNRLKAIALGLQIGRAMGAKGEVLRPLLAELNPNFASGMPAGASGLPAPEAAGLPAST